MTMLRASAILFCAALTGVSCSGTKDSGSSGSSSAASSSALPSIDTPSADRDERLSALIEAEQRRAPSLVSEADLIARDIEVRRAAARALARIAGSRVRPQLLSLLSDEDPLVLAWAAYGLGFDCADKRDETVDAMTTRAASLPQEERYAPAFEAIARAVGQCAGARSEDLLVSWLASGSNPARVARARAAALALGDIVSRSKRLREDTWVALFARAAGGVSESPLAEALFPVTRAENIPPSVVPRLVEVASLRLVDPTPERLFVVKALGRGRETALPLLERILLEQGALFTMQERVEAARAAARLNDDGQVLLGKTLEALAKQPDKLAGPTPEAAVALAALAALKDAKTAPKILPVLVALEAPANLDARAKRIVSMIRCAAARVPNFASFQDARLTGCDLDKGPIGKKARIEVMGRAEIKGPALALFTDFIADEDVRVRERALELLGKHAEIPNSAQILATALAAKEPGIVSVAAEQIVKVPKLASSAPKPKAKAKSKGKNKDDDKPKEEPADDAALPPANEVVDALFAALARGEKEHDPEMQIVVIDAIGALGERDLAKKIEPYCQSEYPTLREHAQNALALLKGGQKPICSPPDKSEVVPPEMERASVSAARPVIKLDTEAGELELELDPSLAPVQVTRIVELVQRGYYDGNVIGRVDPSFVVQFGAPFGDSYAGPPDLPAIRCETSPKPFVALSVGIALSGRDTGSSQMFVMRGRHPHLDGLYPIIGIARGPWETLFEGDTIRKATIASP